MRSFDIFILLIVGVQIYSCTPEVHEHVTREALDIIPLHFTSRAYSSTFLMHSYLEDYPKSEPSPKVIEKDPFGIGDPIYGDDCLVLSSDCIAWGLPQGKSGTVIAKGVKS